jgi:hypothetical protein
MIKQLKRLKVRASSLKTLQSRIVYLENQQHEDHQDVVVYPSVNYNCGGQPGKAFVNEVIKADELYFASPDRQKGGKPSTRLFEEFVYSTPMGAFLNANERKEIELSLVNSFARHAAVRLGWHVNETTGRSDLHILIAAKNNDWPAKLTLPSQFGHGKPCIISVINRVSKEITDNMNKTRPEKLKTAIEVHKEKEQLRTGKTHNLAKELAPLGLAPDELREGIESLGYSVTRENENTISVKFPNSKRASRYNKHELIRAMAASEDGPKPGGNSHMEDPNKADPKAPKEWKATKQTDSSNIEIK